VGHLEFNQWALLAQHVRKGFEYAKQRCTAYPRFVVQRRLLPAFLEHYLPVIEDIASATRWRSPTPRPVAGAGLRAGHPCPQGRASSEQFDEALRGRALPLHRGSVGDGRFVDGQDTSAYAAPACVLEPPAHWSLHQPSRSARWTPWSAWTRRRSSSSAMNVSNGCLVASLATDNDDFAIRVSGQLQAFKVGVNKPRSRGDREEVFGGLGGVVEGSVRRRRPAVRVRWEEGDRAAVRTSPLLAHPTR
jgi:hypothetical protein